MTDFVSVLAHKSSQDNAVKSVKRPSASGFVSAELGLALSVGIVLIGRISKEVVTSQEMLHA